MKDFRLIILMFQILSTATIRAQDGSSGNPFIYLGQANNIDAPGIYWFNLGGTFFSTYVDLGGWVQVAIDFGNGVGNLPQSSTLTNTSRGILQPGVLTKLTDAVAVRFTTNGPNAIDATSTNATLVSRVGLNMSLHKGIADNMINNTWTGTGSSQLTGDASCTTSYANNLSVNLFHPCGNTASFHWMPNGNYQREIWNVGEIPNTAKVQLWVKANLVLPVELKMFKTTLDHNTIKLQWETASELNNTGFQLEHSIDGSNWKSLAFIEGVGTNSEPHDYSYNHTTPSEGNNYYRIEQYDYNGNSFIAPIQFIYFTRNTNDILVFPNPVQGEIIHVESVSENVSLSLFNLTGQQVLFGNNSNVLNVIYLERGIYILVIQDGFNQYIRRVVIEKN